jgi:hypothetical protein
MTDRLTPPVKPPAVTLASRGKTWARLLADGRYLEVARRGEVVTFDLWASARLGRAVVVSVGDGAANEGES